MRIKEKKKIESKLNIYRCGLDNGCSVIPDKFSKKYNLKLLLYYLIIIVLSPVQKLDDRVFFINGKAQNKMKTPMDNIEKVCRGFSRNSILENVRSKNICTPLKKNERFTILLKSIAQFIKNKKKIFFLGTWIEFNYIYYFVQKAECNMLYSRGHYDEITTWMSYSCKLFKKNFIIIQHGIVLEKIKIPNKLYVSEMFCFDKYSIKIFHDNYIENSDTCKFYIQPFMSSVNFEMIEKKNRCIYVGLAEQCNKQWIEEILHILKEVKCDVKVVIMLHPLSKNLYDEDDVIIEKNKKIGNIDFLITDNSTLLLDYYSYDKGIKLGYTSADARKTFSDYEFMYLDSKQTIKQWIESNIKEECDEESIYCC